MTSHVGTSRAFSACQHIPHQVHHRLLAALRAVLSVLSSGHIPRFLPVPLPSHQCSQLLRLPCLQLLQVCGERHPMRSLRRYLHIHSVPAYRLSSGEQESSDSQSHDKGHRRFCEWQLAVPLPDCSAYEHHHQWHCPLSNGKTLLLKAF